jgi:hypothetical protein
LSTRCLPCLEPKHPTSEQINLSPSRIILRMSFYPGRCKTRPDGASARTVRAHLGNAADQCQRRPERGMRLVCNPTPFIDCAISKTERLSLKARVKLDIEDVRYKFKQVVSFKVTFEGGYEFNPTTGTEILYPPPVKHTLRWKARTIFKAILASLLRDPYLWGTY